MKKKLWKFAWLLIVLALAGCKNAEQTDTPGTVITKQPEGQPTPEPEMTATPEPTRTPAPTETPEPTKEPEVTETPEPTSTLTLIPTAAPEPTSTPTLAPTATPEPTGAPTPKPTAIPKEDDSLVSENGCTGILFSLPGEEGARWNDAWTDSETNERIVYKSDHLPKNGKVSVKFCYPNTVNEENRDDVFELFFNGEGMEFTIRDAVEKGVLGEEWTYYEAEGDYTASDSELEILIKTHSGSGSKGISFAIADIKITDTKTGKSTKLDLASNNVDVVCTKGHYLLGKEIEFELFRTSTAPVSEMTPTQNIAELKKSTGVVIMLPDDSECLWEDAWKESGTNIEISIPARDIPEEGMLSVKVCYPKEVDVAGRQEVFELSVDEKDPSFYETMNLSSNDLNNQWTYLELKKTYIKQEDTLKIKLTTHSEGKSKGTVFGIADITILDKKGNMVRTIDLLQETVEINCGKYLESMGTMVGCVYEIRKMWDNTTVVSTGDITQWEKVEKQTKYEKDSKLYGLTYELPESETPWGNAWTESEVNMNFTYVSETPLSGGTLSATLCVPILPGKNRSDDFELTVHAVDDFMNYTTDNAKISYKGEKVYLYDTEIYPENGYYKIAFKVEYAVDKVGNGNELHFALKSHCDSYSETYKVTWCDIMIDDQTGGSVALDMTASNVFLDGKMYLSKKRVLYSLSNTMFDFYVKNKIGKMTEGASYVLDVYTSEPAQISFESTDSSVVSVDKNGKLTAHKLGTCEIKVSNKETGESESFTITVSTPQIVIADYEVFMLTGTETKIEVRTAYANKEGRYTYTSSDATIASIDTTGVLKAKKPGFVTITVEDVENKVKSSYEMEVYLPKDTEGIAKYISIKDTPICSYRYGERLL
ncbi:MAG: Ig-like domain-containing protein [Lachnospiraceae bacterium]|nr:Ig-like domain-containing protein [Lachnospiraceae bacterium]